MRSCNEAMEVSSRLWVWLHSRSYPSLPTALALDSSQTVSNKWLMTPSNTTVIYCQTISCSQGATCFDPKGPSLGLIETKPGFTINDSFVGARIRQRLYMPRIKHIWLPFIKAVSKCLSLIKNIIDSSCRRFTTEATRTRTFTEITNKCNWNLKYSYSTTNKMYLLSQIIYSCKTLYMFRTVFPSIIRSSKLRIQQRYTSNSCCYRGWDGTQFHLLPDSSR